MPTNTRRDFLKAALAVSATLAPHWAIGDRRQKRPNILFALADDWMWPHSSFAREPVVQTPTFDRVARQGVVFTNSFVSAPSCTPSRAAMLTGQWHWRLEAGANLRGPLATRFAVYPDLLEGAGYHVGFTRKGWGPGVPQASGRTRNPAGPQYPDFAAFLAARPKDAPFCFWFGSQDPHRPYERDSGIKSGMKLDAVRVPPYLPDHEIVRRDICDYFWKVQRYDRETGELLAMLEKAGELENTMVVMSGDNGWPFPRCKATVYETGTHTPLAIHWPAKITAGRTVEDFVSLSDLAPTFLEAAGLAIPAQMTARSLAPLLLSRKSGRIDSKRDHVLTGMERHTPSRGEIRGGYPMRAIRTRDFHYIRNFRPDRWPAGDPNGFEKPGADPAEFDRLASNTFACFSDVDSGPTKAYLVTNRNAPAVSLFFERAMGKRPERELYDLRSDPYQLHNLASDARHAATANRLDKQLMSELSATGDPRVRGEGDEFDRYPYQEDPPARKRAPQE